MILKSINLDILAQWVAVGFIVATAILWIVRRISSSHGKKGGCGCSGRDNNDANHCEHSSVRKCSGCPLIDNCNSERSHPDNCH